MSALTTIGLILVASPLVLVVYAYVLYPLILRIAARPAQPVPGIDACPMVTIIVPAYNEELQIRGAIEALVSQTYPADRRQILILSDASSDRTDEIVREYADRGVQLLRMPVRGGKTAAENASAPLVRGEIVVNSDASVRLHPMAVRRLVDALADPRVGVASTQDVSIARAGQDANATEAGYVNYEMSVRSLETRLGGIVGASGSGYAIRASLHRLPIRADLSRDFSAALTARTHGYSAVSVDGAICYVPRTTSLQREYRRKVRTIARGMETVAFNRHLLDPIAYGAFSWKLISHKVCRWLVPPFAVVALFGLMILATSNTWARALLAGFFLTALLALPTILWPSSTRIPKPLFLLTFAAAANIAVVHALLRVWVGHDDHLWEPTRRELSPADSAVPDPSV